MTTTALLSPEEIASQIYTGEVNRTAYDGIAIIEIHCSSRMKRTTAEEKELLTANGYVEMFNYLIVGWDMWARPGDFPNRSFPED
jgi:hypothetical protein